MKDDRPVRAVVVASGDSTLEFLQRRVGSILKGIARVVRKKPEEITGDEADMYLAVSKHIRYDALKELLKSKNSALVSVELALLPVAVRTLKNLPDGIKLGVVAEHISCANVFFSEIIQAGMIQNRYVVGTFNEMHEMQVDAFLVAEEQLERVTETGAEGEVIPLARSISPASAADIINVAYEIAGKL